MKSSKRRIKFKMFNVNQILLNHKVEKASNFPKKRKKFRTMRPKPGKQRGKQSKKEALKGCGETKIEVVLRHYFLSVTTDRFLLEIS